MAGTASTSRVRYGSTVVGVLTVLLALLAMHGLPMQQPGAVTMAAAAQAAAMTSMTTASTAPAIPTEHVPHNVSIESVTPATGAALIAAAAVSGPMQGCESSDHCTATLRADHPSAAPAVVDVLDRTADAPDRTARPASSAARPRPPDLDTLQISRT